MRRIVIALLAAMAGGFPITVSAGPVQDKAAIIGWSQTNSLIRKAACYDQHTGGFLHPGPCGRNYGGPSGYRLYFNGALVSGPDAPGYTRQQARDNCAWNANDKPDISIRCTYNGVTFFAR